MKQKALLGVRVVLGLMFVVFGINFWLQFLPTPPLPERMQTIFSGFMATGYLFQLIKGTEVICGLLLLAGLYVPLVSIILAPITLNILLIHIFAAPEGLPMGILVVALNLALGYLQWDQYKHLFKAR